ncbi:tumor necrosis factor receptor superfamily member 6-like isoform X1 [Scomber scombrus]|uniref:tumor necrosis factor receptor superfamily member 6-like isoform X1 n=1 Tax=Scomber scombrus TaxID=13677 RepID=UPI002DDAAF84|nr:tumor necrosis factor receptor superfamily member 6-like isoform X1 [Scomber scombrus]
MEASDPIMRSYCFIVVFTLFALSATQASVGLPAKFEGKARSYQSKGVIRSRREDCPHGTFNHENIECCKCNKGQRLKEACTATSSTKCEKCENGTYNSLPNALLSCELCISCSQPNANLDVREPCTSVSDTKCQCKKDHYCIGGMKDTCRLCNPCKMCGHDGIKEPCTATSNTVCNGKSEGGILPIILGVVLTILICGIAGTVFFLWKKKRRTQQDKSRQENGNAILVEMVPLNVPCVDLSPFVHDIAEVIEWKDMEAIATRTGVQKTIIEASKRNHPNDYQEQTLELLKEWVEQQGMQASEKLVQMLQEKGRRHTAEKVHDILHRGSST